MDKRIELLVSEPEAGQWEWRIVRINDDGSPGELLGSELGYDTRLEAEQAGKVALDLLAAA
ncbi:hypothetical protein V8Z80_00015 [Orrella sp. JC864]|uniref:hypothetical protein n=1 Tax=Orrella sp. JC864 TaxID=3120298 RepID=UPI0012BB6DFB